MILDNSRARAMAARFVRECEEDAIKELNRIHRSYKVRKKLAYYEDYYSVSLDEHSDSSG